MAWGYYDHPPMVALWIRAGTALVGDTALGIRLLGPMAAAAGTLLLVRAGIDLASAGGAGAAEARRVGITAGWLLNATLVLNAGAVIMTPDTPLLLFWTACVAAVARVVRTGGARWWWASGAAAGLALDSKYTAALLAPCLLAWMVVVPGARPWLRCWHTYGAALLALALFAPVLAWNAAHGWASFARQGGRGGVFHFANAPRNLGELMAGQIGLATPLLFALFCLGVARCARGFDEMRCARGLDGMRCARVFNGMRCAPGLDGMRCARGWRAPACGLVLALTALPALVFIEHAFGDRVQGNWPGVLYPGLALAAALTGVPLQRSAVALGLAIAGVLYVQAAAAPWRLPRRLDPTLIRLGGWEGLAAEIERARRAAGADYVIADEYGLASALAFRLPGEVLGAEARWGLFDLPPARGQGVGLLVRSDRRAGAPDPAVWPEVAPAGVAVRARGGIVAETYHLFRVGPPHVSRPRPSHAFHVGDMAVVRLPPADAAHDTAAGTGGPRLGGP